MSEHSHRWQRAVPVAALVLATVAGLASAGTATADPLGPSGAAKGAPAAAPTTKADAGCTLSPSLTTTSEQASCIGVGAKLSALPALGQTVTLTVTVQAGRVEKATAVTVDLPTTLAFADGTKAVAAVTGAGRSSRATIATVDLARGETRTFTRTVEAVAAGAGEIKASALSVVRAGRTDGGADYVHLTVGTGGADPSRAGIAVTAASHAVARSGPAAAPVVNRPSVALPAVPGAPASPSRAAAPGTSCVTGSWNFVDQAGVTRGVGKVTVQVFSGTNVIAAGYADGVGGYTVCFATGGTTTNVAVRFLLNNPVWKVVNNAGGDFFWTTGVVSVADNSTYNFGGLFPADSASYRANHAYYDYSFMYDWIYQNAPGQNPGTGCWSPYASSCYQLVVHWQADSTDGTYFNTGTGVHLLAASPDSEDEPVHEAGHALMYGLYGNTFPSTTNCSPHYLFSASSTTCGWTEGWADWVDTSVWNNTIYTFASLATTNFNTTWNDGNDTGDQVEARVVQALDSINDGVKYPFDNIAGAGYNSAANYFTVLRTATPTTFAAFWNGRAAAGQDVGQGSLSALYQGTIDYGFRNPLTDGQPRVFPVAIPPHNYSATTTRAYWSAVAVRPGDGGDSDLSVYDDAAQSSLLGSSSYGGTAIDFVAINSNSGARALQTYYPRVSRFTSDTAGYYLQYQQGSSTLSSGTATAAFSSGQVIANYDSQQTSGVPVYYRVVPSAGQSVGLAFLQPGGTIVSRSGAVNSAVGAPGAPVSLVTTPTATGYAGLVLLNQGLTAGNVTVYADTSAPTGSISLNGGSSTVGTTTVPVTLSAADANTGVVSMQISTDGTFDTESVVPYSTSATATLKGANGTKTVYARFLNNAGIWSARVQDSVNLHAAASITSRTPVSGPTAGGTTVTFTGARFTGTTKVTVGGVNATGLVVVSDTKLTAKVPAGTAGAKTVKVFNAYGTSNTTTYTYVTAPKLNAITPNSGPASGGTVVTITGTDLSGVTSVKFGNSAGTNIVKVSSTQIKVTSPDHAAGTIDIRVTTAGGTTAVKTADRFTFT